MKNWLLPILLFLWSCDNNTVKKSPTEFNNKYNIESARKALEIINSLSEGDEISENEWSDLFQSTGYKGYLSYSDSTFKRNLLKEVFITVFDTSQRQKLDSILSVPIQFDEHLYYLLTIRNINSLKQNLIAAESFLLSTDFPGLLKSADSIARQFLPVDYDPENVEDLHEIYFIVSDPDGKVTGNAIILDLNMSASMGYEKLASFIAHEYHHHYKQLETFDYTDPLMVELNKIHQEGLADMIDKEEPPISRVGLYRFYPEAFIELYNETFVNTPQILNELDSITTSYIQGKLDTPVFQNRLKNYFKIGGHPNGFYMTLLINDKFGSDRLIKSFNDPVAFIKLYNDAATIDENEYAFSDVFQNYIHELKSQINVDE